MTHSGSTLLWSETKQTPHVRTCRVFWVDALACSGRATAAPVPVPLCRTLKR